MAPKKMGAMVMGAWFLSSALAHHIAGVIAVMTTAYVCHFVVHPLYAEMDHPRSPERFEALVASDGRALLSGLLVDQAPRLKQVLGDLGWAVTAEVAQGRWGLLEMRRA